MMKYIIERINDTVEVLLLPHKDGRGYSYVNLTKGHICDCVFPSIEAAVMDMEKDPKIKKYTLIEGGD